MTLDQPFDLPEFSEGTMKFPEPKSAEPSPPPTTERAEAAPQAPVTESPEAAPAEPAGKQASQAQPAPAEPQVDYSPQAILQRAVAADPELMQSLQRQQQAQYQQQYPPQQQPQQPPQAPQMQDQGEIDFSQYDLTEATDIYKIIELATQKTVGPALEYIDALKKENAELAERQQNEIAQQRAMEAEKAIHRMMDTYVPGFSEWVTKPLNQLDKSQRAIRQMALGTFSDAMGAFDRAVWGSQALQQEVIKSVGPEIKAFMEYAEANWKKAGDPVASAEAHVQPSSATSATAGKANLDNLFDRAFNKRDQAAETKYINTLFDRLEVKR